MDGTIQEYTLEMGADTKANVLEVKQCDTNSRKARIKLVAFDKPWIIPFGCQIHINVRKTDGTLANAVCARVDESTVMAPITEQMTTVTGTQLGELYFLGNDGDIKSQTFPIVVRPMIMDQARIESSDDFQSLQDSLRQVVTSTEMADAATQYATEQGNQARDAAQRAEDAVASIQVAVDAAANAKACESNAKNSELAAAQTQQEVTDYVESQKAAFVGYSKRESDSKYANALTETATGEGSVTVEDAWTAPVLGLDVVGKSEQVVTTGANLFDIVHADNIKGVASGDELYYARVGQNSAWVDSTKIPFAGESGVSYTLSAKVKCGTATSLGLAFVYTDGTFEMSNRSNSTDYFDIKVTSKADKTVKGFGFIYVSSDTSGYIKDIQLHKGSMATAYEPYTGGAPSPSPDYPQDIISVGTVSTGAQLLNADTTVQGMIGVGTDPIIVRSDFVSSDYIPVKPGDYLLSGNGITPYLSYVVYYDDQKKVVDNSFMGSTNGKFTVPEKAVYVRIRFIAKEGIGGNVTPSEVAALKPMLNAGDAALPWEPYTGGKPSPSVEYPQVVEVTATGKNLINVAEGTEVTSNSNYTVPDVNAGQLYTVTLSQTLISEDGRKGAQHQIRYIDSDGNEIKRNNIVPMEFTAVGDTSVKTQTISLPENTKSILLDIGAYYGGNSPRLKTNYCQFEAGSIASAYEPYQAKSAAIALTAPLRGIGEYRDRIMCREGVWGIERKFIQLTFNGSENWYIGNTTVADKHRFILSDYKGTIKSEKDSTIPITILCNMLVVGSSTKTYSCIEKISSNTEGSIVIYLEDLSSGNVDAFKAYLSTHPINAIFERATPTWEPFPSATQQALNELTTYAGTTHLTITAGGPPAEVTLEYVQDTQKAIEQHDTANRQYTDNQIAAIVAALPTATQAAIVDNQTTKLLQEV